MAYVYRHIRLDKNEPFYIGIGSDKNGLFKRANTISDRNNLWKKVYKKSGGYEVEILMDGLTWEQACEKEKEFIKLYGRINNKTGLLSNLTDGGEGNYGTIVSDYTRQKMSKSKQGRKWSEESKMKHSERLKGRAITWVDKISESRKGYRPTEETKKKMSIARNNSNWDVTKGTVYAYKNGKEYGPYKSASHCSRDLNLCFGHISKCIRGERKTHGGYTFKRIEA